MDADISGATWYGVVADGADVTVTGSQIHDIGENPLNGAQHGNPIFYINGASGTISGNKVYDFQKNGITVSGKAANYIDLATHDVRHGLEQHRDRQGPHQRHRPERHRDQLRRQRHGEEEHRQRLQLHRPG